MLLSCCLVGHLGAMVANFRVFTEVLWSQTRVAGAVFLTVAVMAVDPPCLPG